MRMTMKLAIGGLVLAMAALSSAPADAQRGRAVSPNDRIVVQNSTLRIPPGGPYPIAKSVQMGVSKSLMIQFPTRLRDVLVSDPNRVDAIVQASDRVFLLAKQAGQVNAFFFGENGDQVLTLEITVGVDLTSLDDMLRRMLPGSNIRSEIAGNAVVLNGSVTTPAQSQKAATIANQYARANRAALFSGAGAGDANGGAASGPDATAAAIGTAVQSQAASGTRGSSGGSEKLVINLLTIEGEEQVMLQVVVAEVQRSIMKQFGINLGATINSGNFSTALLTENALPLTAAAGLGKLPIPGIGTGSGNNATGCLASGALCTWNQGPSSGTYGNSGVTSGFGSNSARVATAMRMLERDGLIRTLAEPNLTAVSGETAKFLAGGEYPIPVVDASGQQSVTYKEFGVGVAFTPFVLSEGRISLKIETEVSELTDVGSVTLSNISIPALKKRQAKSTVELPSGGTLAMAGLLSEDTRKNIDGFPGMKDLPVLGTLFRSNDFIKSETELVVMVTPYMVKPVARQKLAKPDDGFAPASDLKFNFLGHLNRVYGKEIPLSAQVGLKDGAGFIIE
jgi:pilus assembly protein CpaC